MPQVFDNEYRLEAACWSRQQLETEIARLEEAISSSPEYLGELQEQISQIGPTTTRSMELMQRANEETDNVRTWRAMVRFLRALL